MVKVYAQLIKKGFKTIDDVPEKLREKVSEELSLMQGGVQEEVTEDPQDKVEAEVPSVDEEFSVGTTEEDPKEDEEKVEEKVEEEVTENPQDKVEDEAKKETSEEIPEKVTEEVSLVQE